MTERDKPASEFSIRRKAGKRHASIPIRPNREDLDGAIRDAKKDLEALRPEFRKLADHGRTFKDSRRGKDALGMLAERTVEGLQKELGRRPKAREIWNSLADYDENHQIIDEEQDVDDVMYWRYRGRERKTTYKAFQHRLTELFKKRSHN